MKKSTTIWLIIATALVLIGGLLFVGVMAMQKWDFKKLSTAKYETNTYTIEETYGNIEITTKSAAVVLVPAENDQTTVVCHEQKNVKHSVQVKENTLVIQVMDSRKWYDHIGFFFESPSITVYLPQEEFGALSVKADTGKVEIPKEFRFESMEVSVSTGDVKNSASVTGLMRIKTTTGSLRVEDVSAGTMELSVSTGTITVNKALCNGDVQTKVTTGKAEITDLACKNLLSKGSTGELTLCRVIATGKFTIERSTGDTTFDSCDAAEIYVTTSTGDVRGSLLTDKIFLARTDTGKVNVPETTTGGRCEITTNTGDIHITVN